MSDLSQRLRNYIPGENDEFVMQRFHEAADEIERLQHALSFAEITAQPLYSRRKLEEENKNLTWLAANRNDAIKDALAEIDRLQSQLVQTRKALEPACERLQSFLNTFGDLGGCVTDADLNDWRAALSDETRDDAQTS